MRQKFFKIADFTVSSQVAFLLVMELVVGVVLTLLAVGMFMKLGDNVWDGERIRFDQQVMQVIQSTRTPELTAIMRTVTFLGGEWFVGGATVGTILLLMRRKPKTGLVFMFILLFGISINLLLKNTFDRPRPGLEPLITVSGYSFPSGHAMDSFIFYVSLSVFVFLRMKNNQVGWLLTSGCLVVVGLVGISRVYLGVHYPSDVVAGYLAGMAWLASVMVFEKSLDIKRLYKGYLTFRSKFKK